MREFIDIVNETTLNEFGPNRLMSHFDKGTPFFMVSAYKSDLPEATNRKRSDVLKKHLSSLSGVSFKQADGVFEGVSEKSFLVLPRSEKTNTGKFLEVGKKLCKALEQQCVLMGDGEKIFMSWSDGSTSDEGQVVTFDGANIKELLGYTTVGNTKFGITTADQAPSGVVYGRERA